MKKVFDVGVETEYGVVRHFAEIAETPKQAMDAVFAYRHKTFPGKAGVIVSCVENT